MSRTLDASKTLVFGEFLAAIGRFALTASLRAAKTAPPRVVGCCVACCLATPLLEAADAARDADGHNQPMVVIAVGAGGSDEYQQQFAVWAERWAAAAQRGAAAVVRIGPDQPSAIDRAPGDGEAEARAQTSDRDRLRDALAAARENATAPLWVVLIGHGTFDGRAAKFNLRGPDVTSEDLAQWTAPLKRPWALIDCSSASGSFLSALSGAGRILITATRSGAEHNFARFGDALSTAIDDPAADLDKDGQTSLLEAFLFASRRTEEFYAQASRLSTEHALLDDNGDGRGTPAAWFQGTRATQRAKDGAAPDGALAHAWRIVPGDAERQLSPAALQRRDALERAIEQLRASKSSQSPDEYYAQLETLLVEMARLYEASGEPAK